jgi:hypothetical protein
MYRSPTRCRRVADPGVGEQIEPTLISPRKSAETLMERSDQSLIAKVVLFLGALMVVGYSVATAGDVLYGDTSSAFAWVVVLALGLTVTVLVAAFVERRCAEEQ